jgi:GDP-L-fucose synthase
MEIRDRSSSIYVAGHRGLVGSALVRALARNGYSQLITRTSSSLDLRDQAGVNAFFESSRPEYVIVAAAKVGGILANRDFPVTFLADNLAIELNIIQAAAKVGVKRLIFLGSSCVYPKHAEQPLTEASLLTGALEPTNQWYAVAKIAGIKLCEAYHKQSGHDFLSVMPTNLYGPNDNFDLKSSHVLPALIRKFYQAKEEGPDARVSLWGTGAPRREFLHVDDLADACVHILETPEEKIDSAAPHRLINVGVGADLSIAELATLVQRVVGSQNRIEWDHTKPDGTPRKLLDVSIMKRLGWDSKIPLEDGIRSTYNWFVENVRDVNRSQ